MLAATTFSFGLPILESLHRAYTDPPYTFGALLFYAFAVFFVYPIAAVLLAISLAFQGSRRHVVAGTIVLASFLLLALLLPARKAVLGSGDYVRLATSVLFAGQTAAAGGADPRMFWTLWRTDRNWMSPSVLEFLVYDDSDGFALPDGARSDSWKQRALSNYHAMTGYTGEPPKGLGADGSPYRARHLLGHYYVVAVL